MKPWAQGVIALCIGLIIAVFGVTVAIFVNAAMEDHMASSTTTTATSTVGTKSNPPATDEENLRAVINYVKTHNLLVVWLPDGQREAWTMEGNDIIELDFYTGSGPLSDPSYDPGTVFIKIEDGQIKFGDKKENAKKIDWTVKDDFSFSTILSRAVNEMKKKESG
jgi:hypothetical protein